MPAIVLIAALGIVSVSGTLPAAAGQLTKTTVTIKTNNGDFWGYIKSPWTDWCAVGRKVVLFKQKGAMQKPKTDRRVATDTASRTGGRYMWSTGNTGLSGKFYARVAKTDRCTADTSPTVVSVR